MPSVLKGATFLCVYDIFSELFSFVQFLCFYQGGGVKKKLQKEELHTNNMSVVQYYKEIFCCLQREASAQCGYFENIIHDKNIETAQN
jgi:hypothetical protein